ncbi:MAG TPA: hypothetical protein VJ483_08850 [Holophagaceae bacterium]|nr:hypothetical protein [Holophagaceae bacterium]
MRRLLLLLAAGSLLAMGLACAGSSSSGNLNLGSTPAATTDFTTFVKQQVVTHPENTQPVDISATTFTGTDTTDPAAFNSVLPPAAQPGHPEAAQ